MKVMVDAGRDVMDDAAVDALFFTAGHSDNGSAGCPVLDLTSIQVDLRPATLLSWSKSPSQLVDFSYFRSVPGNSFAYSASREYLKLWQRGYRLDPDLATVSTGEKTFDDFRFLRVRWEIKPNTISQKWFSVDTGGDYQVWCAPSVFVQNWLNDGAEMRAFAISRHGTDAQVIQSSKRWFRSGLSYPYTSSIGFWPRVLPKGTIFSSDSIAIHPKDNNDSVAILSLLASSWTSELLNCFGEGRKTENSLVKSLPVAAIGAGKITLEIAGLEAIALVMELERVKETSPYFLSPYAGTSPKTICERLQSILARIDTEARVAYGLPSERQPNFDGRSLVSYYVATANDQAYAAAEVSYFVGIAFKRWDIGSAIETQLGRSRMLFMNYQEFQEGSCLRAQMR